MAEEISSGPLPGAVAPWKALHRGIEYSGELILSDDWHAELGRELEQGDIHFRIVALTRHVPVPARDIEEQRLAVCIPSPATRRYRALRERRAPYAAEEPGGKAQLLGEQRRAYASGTILTKGRLHLDPRRVFSLPDEEASFNSIVSALLGEAYPALPIDASALPRPISAGVPQLVFEGFFDPEDAEAKQAVADFAVALGLARRQSPDKFDPQDCPVFPIIAAQLKKHRGSLATTELYRELACPYGLPRPLITLYLLCFVRYAEPALELLLKPGHGLLLRSGERFPGERLTPPYIAEVRWRVELWRDWERLGYSKEPLWQLSLPYARNIEPSLEESTDPEKLKHQEGLLLQKLAEMAQALKQAAGTLQPLAAELKSTLAGEVTEALERLSRLCGAKSGGDFYRVALEEYQGPSALAEDMALYQRLCQLGENAADVLKVKSYLEGAILRESDAELNMDRVSILEQLNLDNLLSAPHLWPSIKALFHWFQPRYGVAYQDFHRDYQRQLASLHSRLLQAQGKLEALRRLNSIAELGPPLAEELLPEYELLLVKVRPCPAGDEIPTEEQPLCPQCGLALGTALPTQEVERFLNRLEKALQKQHHRLSAEAIRQILSQGKESRVDQFIKVLQTSDLSSLANVLDDELVEFLRLLLAEAQTVTLWSPIWKKLSQRFPALEEGEMDEVLAQLAQELRSAFDAAKKENPGKRIRIVLE